MRVSSVAWVGWDCRCVAGPISMWAWTSIAKAICRKGRIVLGWTFARYNDARSRAVWHGTPGSIPGPMPLTVTVGVVSKTYTTATYTTPFTVPLT